MATTVESLVPSPDQKSDLRPTLVKYRFLILAMVIFFAGLLLLIFAEELGEVWRDLGISFIVAATVGLGVEFYTRREAERVVEDKLGQVIEALMWPRLLVLQDLIQNNSLRALGVKQVYIDRLKLDFLHYIRDAQPGCEVRLMGICMNRLANQEAQAILRERLNSGCSVKLLLLEPDSQFVATRAVEECRDAEQFQADVKGWDEFHQRFWKRLPAGLRERMEIRHYDSAPDYFIVDNDQMMLVSFYLRGQRGERVPHIELEIKENGAHVAFRRHFDAIWAASASGQGALPAPVSLADRRQISVPVPKERRREQRRKVEKPVAQERRKQT